MLISVSKAEQLIHAALPEPKITTIPLSKAHNYVLASDIKAERDYPPFDRITKDGIALVSAHVTGLGQLIRLRGYAQAGKPKTALEDTNIATEVATGAPLPQGADTVIPYENIEKRAKEVRLNTKHVSPGQNIHHQASDCQKGTILIKNGTLIGSPEIAMIGSNGMSSVEVYTKPRIAIVTTGDELVAINAKIEPHQIRRSNDVMLLSTLQGHGFTKIQCCHIADNVLQLQTELKKILSIVDVVLISGGVSKGNYDLIPGVLKKLAVKNIFHGICQHPGKPMWFGKKKNTLVFGLPGNPVSTLVCALRYVLPMIKKMSGHSELRFSTKTLGEAVDIHSPFTTFLPVKVNLNHEVIPVASNGSGDFISLGRSSGFIELPHNTHHFYAGEQYRYTPWRTS